MVILYLPRFVREYKKLPIHIKDFAEKREKIFRKNPFASRLKTHKLQGELREFYAFSINQKYRIIFDMPKSKLARFYSIGTHAIYE